MVEIVTIGLDNEMDLILAHKRSMKLAELCGLPAPAQTRFSTAVSEVARCAIAHGEKSFLKLGITPTRGGKKDLTAVIYDREDLRKSSPDAFTYAKKLSGNLDYGFSEDYYTTTLGHDLPFAGTLSEMKIKGFKDYFKFEPPLSPYDEIRKKNIQLIELSEKLSESENKYRQLADTLPLLIFTIDERNAISLTNKWLRDYLARPMGTLDKAIFTEIAHPEDSEALLPLWEKAKADKSPFTAQLRLKHKGGYVWHLMSVLPQKAENAGQGSWIGFMVDINAQKLVEETLSDNTALREAKQLLRESNEELTKKNRDLEEFAFVASHDLQEPLRKIMTMTSMAGRHLSAKQKGMVYFDRINAAAKRMSNLIADVLNYSRVSEHAHGMETVDLNAALAEVLTDLSLAIEDRDAEVTFTDLPAVKGSALQLQQLFYNLISNSLKFSTLKPRIFVSGTSGVDPETLVSHGLDPEKKYARIQVSDNGIGIDKTYASKIFTMFQRLHHRDTYEGNGIGLALCRKVVENHNGAITFSSVPGEGTTFEIFLPE